MIGGLGISHWVEQHGGLWWTCGSSFSGIIGDTNLTAVDVGEMKEFERARVSKVFKEF